MTYRFKNSNKIDLSIYSETFEFNEYNIKTKDNLSMISELLEKDYFEVPYYIRKRKWGEEKVYLPFTNKLFKVINTSFNDTSVQLHPSKTEVWYPLKNSNIYNGKEWINVGTTNKIIIPSHTIHCMKRGSIVFEEQDNNFLDNNETIRLFDINKREIKNKYEYINYILPQHKNKMLITINKNIMTNNDFYLFVIDGINKIKEKVLDKNKLYYVKKELLNDLVINGNVIISEAIYYKMVKYDGNY